MRKPTTPRHRGSSGYLLVETLATLAISAAILAGLASALGLVLRTGGSHGGARRGD